MTLIDDKSAEPLLEATLKPPIAEGFHKIDLAEHDVTLQAGVVYQWFVAYVPNPDRRSNDVIASGALRRVPRTAESDSANPLALAKSGVWYDTVMLLQNRLESGYNATEVITTLQALADEVDLQVSLSKSLPHGS